MKIKYKVNKHLPNVQYIAELENLPMAAVNPELTPVEVKKTRLEKKGITIEEEKELYINIFSLFIKLLVGNSLRQIVEEKEERWRTFDYKLEH